MDSVTKLFGRRLRELRKAAGMTQEELAAKVRLDELKNDR